MSVITPPSAPTHTLPGTSFTSLATPSTGSTATSIWKVEVAPGTEPTPHRLTRGEVFVVVAGTATVTIDAETGVAGPGDVIVVPPLALFELRNDGDTPLEALCAMPTDGRAQIDGGEPFTPPWAT